MSILNDAYDFLVIQDFKLNLHRSEKIGQSPISDRINLINFERDIYYSPEYNKSSSPGFWTPRVLLGQSILKAVQLGARVVVIDFELSKPIPVYSYENKEVDENSEFLDLFQEAAVAARNNNATIILTWERESQSANSYNDRFNEIIDRYNDVIKRGSSLAYSDPSDYQVRHFSFYEQDETSADPLLSTPLLAAIYSWYGPAEGKIVAEKVKEKIKEGGGKISIRNPDEISSHKIILPVLDPQEENLSARFLFRLLPEDMTKTLAKPNENVFVRHPDLMLRPDVVLSMDDREPFYQDKIVIIGSTNPEMGDIHPTPLGEIPGVFLITNGVNLMISGLQIHKPNIVFVILLETLIILVTSLFFLHLSPKMAFLALIVLFYISNTFVSLYVFSKFGMFVDFWLPMIGIGLHKNISELENFLAKKYA